jgi:hypothetical protein
MVKRIPGVAKAVNSNPIKTVELNNQWEELGFADRKVA